MSVLDQFTVDERRQLKKARVLVSGATGFLGSHLVRQLVSAGAIVHGVTRQHVPRTALALDGVHWHTTDVRDEDAIVRAAQEALPDIVFNLAAYGTDSSQLDVDQMIATNIVGAWHVWKAVAGRRCRVVHVGTCGEYGAADGVLREDHPCSPRNYYAVTKHAAVRLLTGLAAVAGVTAELVVVRPFGPFGPGDSELRVIPYVIRGLLRGDPIQVTAAQQSRDFTYVDDHVNALIHAGMCRVPQSGAIYNVGSGNARRIRDVIQMIADEIGVDMDRHVSFGALSYRPDDSSFLCADIGAARRDLGYSPRTPFREGIARTVAWYRDHLHAPQMTASSEPTCGTDAA